MADLYRPSHRSFILLVACCATLVPMVCRATSTYVSYAFAKRYEVSFSDEELRKTPVWDDDTENPPISARKAIQLADAMRAKLVKDGGDFKWKRVSATILFVDAPQRCVWEVRYEAKFDGNSSGPGNWLRLFVLMDGTILQPKISRAPFQGF